MEFGIGLFGDIPLDKSSNNHTAVGERLRTLIEGIKLADAAKLDIVAVGEHHRPDYAIASPEIFLAALATVTDHIKLASGVTVLSSSDPVKVYKDFATIDQLSNGRAEIIAGRGSFIESFPLYGYDLNNYDELFIEKLELLLKLNKEATINWEGQFRAPLYDQEIFPRAVDTTEGVPVWIAVGGTTSSVARAARLGLPIIFAIIGGMPKQFLPLIEYYKEEYIQYGHDPKKMQIGVHSHTFLAPSLDDLIKNYYPYYAAQLDRVGQSRGWSPYTMHQFMGGIHKEGALFMGEADYVTEKLIKLIELFGLTRYIAHIDVGAPDRDALLYSIDTFANKVVPAVKAHFGWH